jgi:hypothetical protein
MDERENNLPKWAKELIADLRLRLAIQAKPLVQELARLRPEMARLKAINEAMTELLDCAARGKHKTSQEIIEIIRSYSLELVKEEICDGKS